jgi:drug/metabolite transporter (DMT)-like permease
VFAFCCYAAGNLLVRGQTALRPAQLTCFSLLITGILFMPFALIYEQPELSQWSGEVWLALIWLGAISTALAFSLRYVLINRAGAGFMSNVGYLIPIVSLLIGYFVLGESISLTKILAMAVILISLYIIRMAGTILRVRAT